MIVYYRVCDIPSTNPSPILQDDKFRLNKYCLRSFVKGFEDLSPKVHFILDYCGGHYDEMISANCPFEHTIERTELGINGTCLRQYDLAKDQSDDEVILFQECDYKYVDSVGWELELAIRNFGLVSPYDHPDMYERFDIHNKLHEIAICGSRHYRTASRNTMTYGVRSDILKKHYDTFVKYGYLDGDVWYDLARDGQKLWTPIPSMATHMVKDCLAPVINWQLTKNDEI